MLTRGIRAFVNRDWEAVRRSKDTYWADRIARLGAIEGFRIAEDLRQQALQRDPTWPDAAIRDDDIRAHVRLSAILHRASPARRR